jgi:hypothetical protein
MGVLPIGKRVIYALSDPRDGLVFYVGVTDNPSYRLKEHLRMPKKESAAKNARIKEMLFNNVPPVFVFLDTALEQDAQAVELKWIAHFNSISPLLNHKHKLFPKK